MAQNARKVWVIGLDGATYKVLDPLMEKGAMPNLKKFLTQGVRGPLQSCFPPVSCPAWFSYSTGKNPDKLGMYGWESIDEKNQEIRFNSYTYLNSKEFWDYLGYAGLKCGVINIPLHFPPRKINGYMVCGMQASELQDYTYPPELKAELKKRFDYRPDSKYRARWDSKKFLKDAKTLFKMRFDASFWLLEKVDFLHTTIFRIDEVQHYFWGGPEVEEAWKFIDTQLGRVLNMDIDIILMSDHGFGPADRGFNLNTWLEREGYLTLNKNQTGQVLRKVGLNRQRLQRMAKKYDILPLLKKITPTAIQNRIVDDDGSVSQVRREALIDWKKSKVLALGEYGVFLFDEKIKKPLKEELLNIEDEDGKKIFKWVKECLEVYGYEPINCPKVMFSPDNNYRILTALGNPELYSSGEGIWKASHRMDGLFAARGPGFKKNTVIEDASLVDLAPTILGMFQVPIPEDMDGNFLFDAFSAEPKDLEARIKTQRSDEISIKKAIGKLSGI